MVHFNPFYPAGRLPWPWACSAWGLSWRGLRAPATEKFERVGYERSGANVRQIDGRRGEVWLPESGTEHISVIRTA